MINKKTLLMLVTTCVFFDYSPSFAMEHDPKQPSSIPVHPTPLPAPTPDVNSGSGILSTLGSSISAFKGWLATETPPQEKPVCKTALTDIQELEKGFNQPSFLEFPETFRVDTLNGNALVWRGLSFLVTDTKDIDHAKSQYDARTTFISGPQEQKSADETLTTLLYKCKATSTFRYVYDGTAELTKTSPCGSYASPTPDECQWARQTLGIDMASPLLRQDFALDLMLHATKCKETCSSKSIPSSDIELAHKIILLNQKVVQQQYAAELLARNREASQNSLAASQKATDLHLTKQQLREQLADLIVAQKEIERLNEELKLKNEALALKVVEEAARANKAELSLKEKVAVQGQRIVEVDPTKVKLRSASRTQQPEKPTHEVTQTDFRGNLKPRGLPQVPQAETH